MNSFTLAKSVFKRVEMEEVYKRYLIRSGAEMRDGIHWKPIAQINWTEDGKERVKLWMEWYFTRSFATYKDAEMEAHVFAKDWIDNRNLNSES
ncbi:MAG TPA: hypothetical protein VN843_12590 [Anaerolineales bacterium]|nr:hypothetical protein [Anaerolineales bacterium]